MVIEAASLQDAIDEACTYAALPDDGQYLMDSFRINVAGFCEQYPEKAVCIPKEHSG